MSAGFGLRSVMCSPVMCFFEAGAWPGRLSLGWLTREELRMGISRSPRCKRLERVAHLGIEIWVSGQKYCVVCDAGGGDAGRPCTETSGAARLPRGEPALLKQKLCPRLAARGPRFPSSCGSSTARSSPQLLTDASGGFELSWGCGSAIEADPKPCSFWLCLVGPYCGVTPRLCF